jgi:signal transduction histidine kinase
VGAERTEGAVFVCDGRGLILETVMDGFGLADSGAGPASLFDFADSLSQVKLSAFLAQVRELGAALSWEINVRLRDRVSTLNFFGVARGEKLFVAMAEAPGGLFRMYDELLGTINEQAAMLRQVQKEMCGAGEAADSLEGFMRLNNDLVNAQRELTKKNHQLARQEEKLRRLLNENPDAQIVLDMSGRVLFHNPVAAVLYGRPGEDLVGRTLDLAAGDSGPEELVLARPDGRAIHAEVRRADVEWEEQPANLFSLRDVTARKEMEALREDVERMAKHDLRGPLNAVINLPGLVIEDAGLKGEPAEMLRMVRNAGRRMLEMINRSLDLFKMERGTYQLEPSPVDMAALARQVAADLAREAGRQGVEVRLAVDGGPGDKASLLVQGEELLLYPMLSNVLQNAIQASPQGDAVDLSLRREQQWVVVRVHNQGAVHPAVRDRFFEKYATAGKKGGTGLGNYSARLTAETHGGDVAMETSEESGTIVTVRLPLQAGRAEPE